ncbi:hypothetical protein HGRIS_002911 [Hohenbuehelia grisea]|uniref:Uncharacterized protein n=1 Tax=Hohenbuehelia grisea TaxID=104357 RepID=A0ABR3JN88_9AGAR
MRHQRFVLVSILGLLNSGLPTLALPAHESSLVSPQQSAAQSPGTPLRDRQIHNADYSAQNPGTPSHANNADTSEPDADSDSTKAKRDDYRRHIGHPGRPQSHVGPKLERASLKSKRAAFNMPIPIPTSEAGSPRIDSIIGQMNPPRPASTQEITSNPGSERKTAGHAGSASSEESSNMLVPVPTATVPANPSGTQPSRMHMDYAKA